MVETSCAQCGEVFLQKPWRGKTLCSRACFYASGRGGRKPGAIVTIACDSCGSEFERRARDVNSPEEKTAHAGNYCSLGCYRRPKLAPEEAQRRAYAVTARWRSTNREHVQAYKRAAYRRAEIADTETRAYVEVIRRDPCVYCGAPSDTIDHIVPISVGGRNHWSNLAPACRPCNSGKKDRRLLLALLARA